MLRAIVLLEGETPSQSQISGRQKQVSPKNFPIFSAIIPSILTSFPVPDNEKHPHSMMLPPPCFTVGMRFLGWWEVLDLHQTCSFLAIMENSILVSFDLLPYVRGVFHMPFGEHQTYLLIFFYKQWLFFWPLFHKAHLFGVYSLKWSYGQILQSPLWSFAAPSVLSLGSLLPLWLIPSLPGPWVLVGSPLLAGLLWCHILSIF